MLFRSMGNIVLHGEVLFDSNLLTVIEGGEFEVGLYYLSSASEGKITASKPAVGVLVAAIVGQDADNNYRVFVMPHPRSALDEHVHYKISLSTDPAGTVIEAPGDTQSSGVDPDTNMCIFTSVSDPNFIHEFDGLPDPDLIGWLPANDTTFDGMIVPEGAKFGYNIQKDPRLRKVWPPVPPGNVYVEINGIGASPNMVKVNSFGIWWMDDCLGRAPWPVTYSNTPPGSSSSSAGCVIYDKRIDIWFTKMVFRTASNTVTSLEPLDETVKIVCAGTDTPASVGDLQIGVNLSFAEAEDDTGYIALKNFDATALRFTKGKIVSRVKSISNSIVVAGDAGPDDDGFYQGAVTLQYVDVTVDREGVVQLIALDNVTEESESNILYLGFPSDRDSSIRGKISIGKNAVVNTGNLKLYFWLLANQNGTLPPFKFSYRVLPRPATSTSIQTLPISDSSPATLSFPGAAIASNGDYVYVELATSTISSIGPGSVIFFTLTRNPVTDQVNDTYNGTVGLIQVRYSITPIS